MSSERTREYQCALTAKRPKEADLVEDAAEDDDLGDMPLGVMQITVSRRRVNPEYESLLRIFMGARAQVEAQVIASMKQVGMAVEGDSEEAKANRAQAASDAKVTARAQFAYSLNNTPRYETATEVVYVRDPSLYTEQERAAWKGVCKLLQIPEAPPFDEEEE